MTPGMPALLHYSDQDCIYSIDSKNYPRDMLKMTVEKFPEQLQECRAFIQITSTGSKSDLVGTPMAYFDSMDTVKRFSSSIFNPHRFTLIKLTNCFYNSEAIAIKLDRVPSIIWNKPLSFIVILTLRFCVIKKIMVILVYSRAIRSLVHWF